MPCSMLIETPNDDINSVRVVLKSVLQYFYFSFTRVVWGYNCIDSSIEILSLSTILTVYGSYHVTY